MLGEFPELTKAVRTGDLAAVSILCAQLFDLDASRRTASSQSRPLAEMMRVRSKA
jgi:hypothetical protein